MLYRLVWLWACVSGSLRVTHRTSWQIVCFAQGSLVLVKLLYVHDARVHVYLHAFLCRCTFVQTVRSYQLKKKVLACCCWPHGDSKKSYSRFGANFSEGARSLIFVALLLKIIDSGVGGSLVCHEGAERATFCSCHRMWPSSYN